MVFRSRTAVSQKAFDDLVDDDTVLGMHTDQPTTMPRRTHCSKDRGIVRQKNTRIRHKKLERGHTLVHELIHLLLITVLKVGRDEMKAVIDACLALSFFMPCVHARGHR